MMDVDSYFGVHQDPIEFHALLKDSPLSSQKGVYYLYWFRNGKPRALQRLCGIDKEGVLYIGMTDGPLLKRVCNLQQALISNADFSLESPCKSRHTQMGMKYYRIRKKVLIEDLHIQFFSVSQPKLEESIRLDNYVKAFGELPPLNGQYGSVSPKWETF